MKRNNRRISDLFYNNRFLLVFSIIFAVAIWLVIAVEFGEEVESTITIDAVAEERAGGLVPFGEKDFKITVVVKGKKYIVESKETKENIYAVLNTSHAGVAGKDTAVNVEVRSKELRPLYEIKDFYPKTVSVFYDYEESLDFNVEPDITYADDVRKAAAVGYKMDKVEIVSDYTVNIKGPKSEVENIEKVYAKASLKSDFRETQNFTADLVLESKNGVTLNYCEPSFKTVQFKADVYKSKDLKPEIDYSNPPADYIDNLKLFEVTVNPQRVNVGLPEDQLEGRDSFKLATKIDFSQLHEGENIIRIPASSDEVPGGILIENISEFVVTIKVPAMNRKEVKVPENVKDISINVPDNLDLELVEVDFRSVTVIGPPSELSTINTDTLVFTADFSGIDESQKGELVTVPVKLFDESCWAYGKEAYNATFIIK